MEKIENTIEKIDSSVKPKQDLNLRDIRGFIEIVSSAPTEAPTRFEDQIKFYVNSGDYRIYFYDTTNKAWRYMYNYVHP